MKKFVFGVVFTFLTMSIFGQIPSAVVSDFSSRARDVHEDDLVTVMEMFMNTLAASKTVNVIDRTILEKEMTAIKFGVGDWSDKEKTAQLGEKLNAIYLVSGTMTQLGTSLTFSISVRDIKTLAVIASDQKQYTLENVWDNSAGIPAQLSDMATNIARGISTDHNKRQQALAQLQRQQAEAQAAEERRQREAQAAEEKRQKAEEEKRYAETIYIAGYLWQYGGWRDTYVFYPDFNISLRFNSDGTFTGVREHSPRAGRDSRDQTYDYEYSGTYTRNSYIINLSGIRTTTINHHNRNGKKDSSSSGPRESYTGRCEIILPSGNTPMNIKWEDYSLYAR